MAGKKLPEHGTRARYRAKCGCEKCKKWKADDTAAYRARKAERDGKTPPKRATKRARPTPEFRPTEPTVIVVGEPGAEAKMRDALTVRRPSSDDELAQLIDAALWEARGDSATASVLAAEAIRSAGYRRVVDGAIEAAAREALGEPADAMTRMRQELVFRGARALDDPENARFYKSTVEAMRSVLADLAGEGGADDAAAIMDAIRSAARD